MKLDDRFPDKRAFVTGAASGLGFAICQKLAKSGWRIFIADVNEAQLANAEASLVAMGAEVVADAIDVTNRQAIANAVSQIESMWDGIDIVFNNAGIAPAGSIYELTEKDWRNTIDIDLWGVIHGCVLFAPLMKRQGSGHIVNTASAAGILAAPELAAYNVAKAGVVSLSETLRTELSKDNIGVSVVCPMAFRSSIGKTMDAGRDIELALRKRVEQAPVAAEDIADMVINAILNDRLYVITHADARWGWRFKRLFPELYTKLVGYLYRKRLWIYSH